MLVKTKDDQQYGVVTTIRKQEGSTTVYLVQCHGHLPNVGPWMRKCGSTFRSTTSISIHDVVLIGYNYQDKKTGSIAYVYSRSDKGRLVAQASDYEVPLTLVNYLRREGYEAEPSVSFESEEDTTWE